MRRRQQRSTLILTLFPYTTLFRSNVFSIISYSFTNHIMSKTLTNECTSFWNINLVVSIFLNIHILDYCKTFHFPIGKDELWELCAIPELAHSSPSSSCVIQAQCFIADLLRCMCVGSVQLFTVTHSSQPTTCSVQLWCGNPHTHTAPV